MYKVLFRVLGCIRGQIIKFLSITSLVGALFATSCLLQGLKEVKRFPHPPAAIGAFEGTQCPWQARGRGWGSAPAKQSDLGAEISPHVTRAGDTIHDVGRTQGMGPDLVPSHCGQEGKRWGDPKTPHWSKGANVKRLRRVTRKGLGFFLFF